VLARPKNKLKQNLFGTFFACLGISGVLVAVNLLAEDQLPYGVKLACFFVVATCTLIGIGCIVAWQVLTVRGWLKS